MASDPGKIVTRFAPSPTGELHIGGARTALYAWAFAKRHGGVFQLRFEDTDLARSSDASAQRMLEDLAWLGLMPENFGEGEPPPTQLADIPRQSKRHADGRYDAIVEQLKASGDAYDDGDAVRFRMGDHRGDVTFDDAVYGTVHTPAKDLEDFVIRKGEAGGYMPTFHLAVVVDDHDFGCTHVIRGQEHLSNTAKHAALCDALGWQRPVWAHTPSIMNPGGSKMSKRDKAKAVRNYLKQHPFEVKSGVWGGIALTKDEIEDFLSNKSDGLGQTQGLATEFGIELPEILVADFRKSGYLVEPLLNYVALLGWNPGDDQEKFGLDFMAAHFSLDRINKANSTFDRAKLAAFNQDAILAMPPEEWETKLHDHFRQHHPGFIEKLGDQFGVFAAAYQERSKTLSDPATLGRFFVKAPVEFNAKAVKKNLTKNEGQGLQTLSALKEILPGVEPWDAETIRATLERAWQDLGGPHMGQVAQPLRVALTGTAVSPEIDATLALLGKQETLDRIEKCLQRHEAANSA